jgi:hypothetical protein
MGRYADIVAECCPTKSVYVAPGNHELLSWYSQDEVGERDYHMARFLEQYPGWDRSPDGRVEMIKTICFNEKGEVDPDGNDVLVLLACYSFTYGQEGHKYTCKNFTVETDGTNTVITVKDENFIWNKEWFGDRYKIVDGKETPSIDTYTLRITGVDAWDNGIGYYVDDVKENVLTLRAALDVSVAIPTDGVTFESLFVPASQLYLARNNSPVEVNDEHLYAGIKKVFAELKDQGKRIFVVQHVPVTDSYPEAELTPTNMSYLYRSLFYGTTVFSGHTHHKFEEVVEKNNKRYHGFTTYAGFNSVHIPSTYDHAQAYVVDVYENGLHLRGKKFRVVDGKTVSEDVPLGTYWVDTREEN